MSYECQYCHKSFRKEITLSSHVCESKRRFQQEREIGVQWGLQAYLKFYQSSQTISQPRSYKDFVGSSYYTAFVKFGRHCHDIHCVNFNSYIQWLLKNNKKLDSWCKESFYSEWLFDYLRKESAKDALERSLKTIIDFMHDHPEYLNGYKDYFRLVNENRICYHIVTGRISAWAVYNCESGQDFLSRLNDDQVTQIINFIDPDFWKSKFRDCPQDVDLARQVFELAGL